MKATPSQLPLPTRDWLIRLRWIAVLGQLVVIFVGNELLDGELPLTAMLAVVAAVVASNLFLTFVTRAGSNEVSGRISAESDLTENLVAISPRPLGVVLLGTVILFDVAALSTLLYFSGGAANPFGFFYVVHVAIAALLLGERWTWVVATLSAVLYGALFFFYHDIPALSAHGHHSSSSFSLHLQGMWIAFALVAATLAFFFTRFVRASTRQAEKVRMLEDRAARAEKLSAISAVGAAAAHELNTPLCTITVAASEMLSAIEGGADGAALRADTELIRDEVERCREVLSNLRRRSGDFEGEMLRSVPFGELVASVQARLSPADRARIECASHSKAVELLVPPGAFGDVLSALVRNGLESGAVSNVRLEASKSSLSQKVTISDDGRGVSAEVRARLGEPFVTSKAQGGGLGLGVYLAKSLVERLDGSLVFETVEGSGTRVRVELPVAQ